MKRTIIIFLLILGSISFISAQEKDKSGPEKGQNYNHEKPRGFNQRPGGPREFSMPGIENVNITGYLSVTCGTIAVTTDGITYLTLGLNRFIGFIDGLKEGAKVSLEGNTISHPAMEKTKILQVKKMTLNDKEYEIGWPNRDSVPRFRPRYL